MIQRWVHCGLFGALIVRNPDAFPVNYKIPLFVYELAGNIAIDGFESNTLFNEQTFSHVFGTAETSYPYHCKIHGVTMAGNVQVVAEASTTVSVVMVNNTFTPATIQVALAGTVNWFNSDTHNHIVFAPRSGGSSFCLNGRSYVGNTPTIVANAGARLR